MIDCQHLLTSYRQQANYHHSSAVACIFAETHPVFQDPLLSRTQPKHSILASTVDRKTPFTEDDGKPWSRQTRSAYSSREHSPQCRYQRTVD